MTTTHVVTASSSLSPTPSLTPSPTPSMTPVVTHVVTSTPHPSLIDQVNTWAMHVPVTNLVAAGALIAVVLQGLINSTPFFQKLEDDTQELINWVTSFLMPFAVLLTPAVLDGLKTFKYAPLVYVVGQVFYSVATQLKKKAVAKAQATPVVTQADTNY